MSPSPLPKTLLSLVLVWSLLLFLSPVNGLKLPFRAKDVLPLLPRQVSYPILNSLHSAVDLLPTYIGSVASTNKSLDWKATCFYENSAWMEFHNKTGSEFGGGTLHIKVSKPHTWSCMDLYIFATPYRVTWDAYFIGHEYTLEFEEWEGKAEYEHIKKKGVSIFLMEAGMLGTLEALVEVLPLFSNTGWGENSNINFLKTHMGAKFEERPQPWFANVSVDDIHSGDFLAVSRLRGRWGAFHTLEKWVSGAYAGHTAVCLKDSQGNLWVAESGHDNEEGQSIIVVLPWDEWWNFAVTEDDTDPHVALLPLHPSLRAKFNETAAWEYARSMWGKPYGYHNMIFSWIDTIKDNYPPPMDANVVASVMTIWNNVQPDYAANMWNEALNKRLGTEGLELPEIIVEAERRGSSFDELLTIPEQDDWVYSDGKSTTCIALILEMYKEAGLFGPLGNSIQITEFTVKDAYSLNFYENDSSHLPKWCQNDADPVKLPYCQITGKYRMELPGYNTVDPYSHMNEMCPSLAPEYDRPNGC